MACGWQTDVPRNGIVCSYHSWQFNKHQVSNAVEQVYFDLESVSAMNCVKLECEKRKNVKDAPLWGEISRDQKPNNLMHYALGLWELTVKWHWKRMTHNVASFDCVNMKHQNKDYTNTDYYMSLCTCVCLLLWGPYDSNTKKNLPRIIGCTPF